MNVPLPSAEFDKLRNKIMGLYRKRKVRKTWNDLKELEKKKKKKKMKQETLKYAEPSYQPPKLKTDYNELKRESVKREARS